MLFDVGGVRWNTRDVVVLSVGSTHACTTGVKSGRVMVDVACKLTALYMIVREPALPLLKATRIVASPWLSVRAV